MRMRLVRVVFVCCLILMACTNRNIVTEEQVDESELGETYGFTMLQVSFDTQSLKEALVIRYEETSDYVEATYENDIDGIYLHGNEAYDKLAEIFGDMDIDAETDDYDLLKAISEAFEVEEYTSLKLQVTFRGFETKELMLMK